MSCPLLISQQDISSLASWWISNESLINYVGPSSKAASGKLSFEMLSPGTFIGIPFVDAIIKEASCKVEWYVTEGQVVSSVPIKVATINGTNGQLQFCKNLIHNVLSRACGISTFISKFKNAVPNSWKGSLSMPEQKTPGFCLVEEYAMRLSGIQESKQCISLSYSGLRSSGSVEDTIRSVKQKSDTQKLQVHCDDLNEALTAAKAGANIVVLRNDSKKDLSNIASRVKSAHPNIEVHISGYVEETDLSTCATQFVDILSSSKFCNGYPFIDFRTTHVDIHTNNDTELLEVVPKKDKLDPPPQQKSKSPAQSIEEVDRLNSTPTKKARLTDGEGNKPNGTPDRLNESSTQDSNWSVYNNTQNQRRQQRNSRYPAHVVRANTPRNQSPGGMQNNQINNQRAIVPTTMSPRALGMLPPMNSSNQMLGGLNQGMRLPMMQQQQRMPGNAPNFLNTTQPMSGGFVTNIQTQSQQPNWQMPQNSGQMSGVGMGMRMGTSQNMCRSCGVPNNQNMPFCRNCRSPMH